MTTYKQFVASLGEHARDYTPEELRQLYIDVRQVAQILCRIVMARRKGGRPQGQESGGELWEGAEEC